MSIIDYLAEDYRIQCPKIEMRKSSDNSVLISGPGYFHVKANGIITFRIYNEITIDKELFREWNSIEHPYKHYIAALDYSGNKWVGNQPDIIVVSDFLGNNQFPILGNTNQLESFIENPNGSDSNSEKEICRGYGIYYREIVKIPYCSSVEQKTEAGGTVIRERLKRTILPITFQEKNITLQKDIDDKYFYMHGVYPADVQEYDFDHLLNDCLNYCTSSLLRPRLIVHFYKNKIQFLINNTFKNRTQVLPNVLSSTYTKKPVEGEWRSARFSRAFTAYLNFQLLKGKVEMDVGYRDIGTIFANICASSLESPFNFAESLCIGCEYCFNLLTKGVQFPKINKSQKQALDQCITENFSDKLDESQISRVKGLLSLLLNPSTKMKLDYLKEHQVITKAQFKAWDVIRNKLLHGSVLHDMTQVDFANNIALLLCMFYRLTYQLIGYEGDCFNYDVGEGAYKIVEFHYADLTSQMNKEEHKKCQK